MSSNEYTAIDLFCGLGGWSEGLVANNFKVTGVDIENVGYPFELILDDIRNVKGEQFRGIDVIVGSPPCRDFSKITTVAKARHWKIPPDPLKGLELVYEFQRIVKEAQPKVWLMENVPGLVKYFKPPVMTVKLSRTMDRCFWGEFPYFLIFPDLDRPNTEDFKGPLRSWQRAKIPFTIANEFGRVCRKYLSNKREEEAT